MSPLLLSVGLLALTLASAAPFFDAPMQRDQGVYAACGSILIHGGAPYRDCWDTKAPLTHYTYALAQLLFGIDLKGPIILSAILAGLTGLGLWRVARRWFAEWFAWETGLVYALLVVSIPYDMNAQSEGFANLFIVLSVWGILLGVERNLRWPLVGAGIALALAIGYKYTIILPAGVAALGALLVVQPEIRNPAPRRSGDYRTQYVLRLSFFVCLGLSGTIALFTLYLLARGALPFALEHLAFMLTEFPKVVVNPTLLLFPGESGPPLFYLQRTLLQLSRLPVIHLFGLLGLILAIFRRRPYAWLMALWLIAAIASVYPQKVMTLYHWTLSLAPLALGVGALMQELSGVQSLLTLDSQRRETLDSGQWRHWAVAAVSMLVIANLGLRFYQDQWLVMEKFLTSQQTKAEFFATQAIQDEIEVAEYVRDRTTHDDLIWVWGNHSLIYYWADRGAPTRFIFNSPLMAAIGPNEAQPRWKQEVLDALYARPPTYIVITYYDRTWFDYKNPNEEFEEIPGYQDFLDRYYRQETFMGRFAIYRLTPWWSRYNHPARLDAVTVFDLLGNLDSAELTPAPNQPIAPTEFKLYDEPLFPTLLIHPEGRAAFNLALPGGVVCFRSDLALDPQAWGWGGDGATFSVSVNDQKVFERYLGNTVDDRFWQPVIVDLSRWAGQTVSLALATGPGPNSDFTGDLAGWGLPRVVVSPGESCEARVVVK